MAIVPYKGTPDLQPTQNPTPYQHFDINADMFGANVGRAMQGLASSFENFGNTMAGNAVKMQERLNQAHSEDMFNNATIDLGKLDAQQGQLAGKARYDGYDSYTQQVQAIRQKYLDGAGNSESRRLFDQQFSRRAAFAVVDEGKHAATALQQYENDTKSSSIKLLSEQSGRSKDESELEMNLQQQEQKIDELGDLPSNKWSPEHMAVVKGQAKDVSLMNFIQNLTLSNPMRAQQILEKYKDQFADQKNYDSIKGKVDQGMLRAGTRQDADEIWKSVKPPEPDDGTGGNNYLKKERSWIKGELDADPQLHRVLRGVLAHEQSPGERSKVMESLANRLNFFHANGEPNLTLREYLSRKGLDQFYGPLRHGEINESFLRGTDAQASSIDRDINRALNGSNDIKGMTDQGSAGDPNFGHGQTIMSHGEGYNDFGGSNQGAARAWRLAQQQKAAGQDQGGGQQYASLGSTQNDAGPQSDNPVRVAENLPQNQKNDYVSPGALENALSKVDDYATKRYPNDPGMQAMYRDELIQRLKTNYSTDRAVLRQQRQDRMSTVMSETIPHQAENGDLVGPTQLEQLSPQARTTYEDMDWVQKKAVDSMLLANAKRDVALTPEKMELYRQVQGIRKLHPDQFADLNIAELNLPKAMTKEFINAQLNIQKELAGNTKINQALGNVRTLTNNAGIFQSTTNTQANDGYNKFTGAFDQELANWEKEKQKYPTSEEQKQIAGRILQDVAGSGWFGSNWGTRRGYEVPATWGADAAGNSLTTDRVTADFQSRNGRPPSTRELYRMFQSFQAGQR